MNKWMQLGLIVFMLELLAFLTSYFVTEAAVAGWYQAIVKSPLTPPDWVFAPVWTALYVMIGLSLWRIWRVRALPRSKHVLAFFILQLVGNYLWSPVFFGLAAFWPAFWLILGIDVLLAATIITAWRVEKSGALLLLPYFLWALFATHLTHYVALHN